MLHVFHPKICLMILHYSLLSLSNYSLYISFHVIRMYYIGQTIKLNIFSSLIVIQQVILQRKYSNTGCDSEATEATTTTSKQYRTYNSSQV